jgi:hypothetical protein
MKRNLFLVLVLAVSPAAWADGKTVFVSDADGLYAAVHSTLQECQVRGRKGGARSAHAT